MTFDEWLQHGIDNKFCGQPHCYSHGWPEMASEEEAAFEEDGEVCITMIRLQPPAESPAETD